jgi:hypothetical protein
MRQVALCDGCKDVLSQWIVLNKTMLVRFLCCFGRVVNGDIGLRSMNVRFMKWIKAPYASVVIDLLLTGELHLGTDSSRLGSMVVISDEEVLGFAFIFYIKLFRVHPVVLSNMNI